jgi:hypothetical protein
MKIENLQVNGACENIWEDNHAIPAKYDHHIHIGSDECYDYYACWWDNKLSEMTIKRVGRS